MLARPFTKKLLEKNLGGVNVLGHQHHWHMQGTVFGVSVIVGQQYLSAASPTGIVTVPLHVRSVSVENSLQTTAAQAHEVDKTPGINKLLNYFHSMCERFPIDNTLQVASSQQADQMVLGPRKVSLHMVNGATLFCIFNLVIDQLGDQ
jgi:hypothetical protein